MNSCRPKISIFTIGPGGAVVVSLVALFHLRYQEATGKAPVWATSYLDDLICLPLVLSIILLCRRKLAGDHQVLPWAHSFLVLAVFAVYFEIILPSLDPRYTRDPWDVVMYAAGCLVFHWGINQRSIARKEGTEISLKDTRSV